MGARVVVHAFLDYDTAGDYQKLVDRLNRWKDPTVLYGHSCGCMLITKGAEQVKKKPIFYLMAIAPSIFCQVAYIHPNVRSATQGSSFWLDGFNPGSRMLIQAAPGNNVSKIDVIKTGMGYKKPTNAKEVKLKHVRASYSPLLRDRLVDECQRAYISGGAR